MFQLYSVNCLTHSTSGINTLPSSSSSPPFPTNLKSRTHNTSHKYIQAKLDNKGIYDSSKKNRKHFLQMDPRQFRNRQDYIIDGAGRSIPVGSDRPYLPRPFPSQNINNSRTPVYGRPDFGGIHQQTRHLRLDGHNPLFDVGPYGRIKNYGQQVYQGGRLASMLEERQHDPGARLASLRVLERGYRPWNL
jgi:hypothetical protein